jgi:poly(A) polymerase
MDAERGDQNKEYQPYAGRWIARIRDQVIGQGGSAQQAAAIAQSSRFKEIAIISYIPSQDLMSFSPLFFELQKILQEYPQVYLVGGAVRDALLGKDSQDLDFVIQQDAKRLAGMVARALAADFYPMDPERGIFRVIHHPDGQQHAVIDFSAMRGATLEEDLSSRDFTINAMAVDLQDPYKIIDPLGGAQALHDRLLQACSPHSFTDDPVRVLRAIRFAAAGNYHLEDKTRAWMKAAHPNLVNSTIERKRDELMKILAGPASDTALRALDMMHALEFVLPDYGSSRQNMEKGGWDLLLAQVQAAISILDLLNQSHPNEHAGELLSGLAVMKLGRFREQLVSYLDISIHPDRERMALFSLGLICAALSGNRSDASLPEQYGKFLRLSRPECMYLMGFKRGILWLETQSGLMDPLAIYHYYRIAGSGGVDAVFAWCMGELVRAKGESNLDAFKTALETTQDLMDAWWNHQKDWVDPIPFVSGDDLMRACKIESGPFLGKILEQIKENQVTGKIKGGSDALKYAKLMIENQNRS